MSDDLNLAEIEALAKAATPGPWRRVPQKGYPDDYVVTDHPDHQGRPPNGNHVADVGLAGGQDGSPYVANSAHIARMDPATTLRLLAVIDGLKADVLATTDQLHSVIADRDARARQGAEKDAEIERLKAENAHQAEEIGSLLTDVMKWKP